MHYNNDFIDNCKKFSKLYKPIYHNTFFKYWMPSYNCYYFYYYCFETNQIYKKLLNQYNIDSILNSWSDKDIFLKEDMYEYNFSVAQLKEYKYPYCSKHGAIFKGNFGINFLKCLKECNYLFNSLIDKPYVFVVFLYDNGSPIYMYTGKSFNNILNIRYSSWTPNKKDINTEYVIKNNISSVLFAYQQYPISFRNGITKTNMIIKTFKTAEELVDYYFEWYNQINMIYKL